MIKTRVLIRNRWTGETFSLAVPGGVRDKDDLVVTAIVEIDDGLGGESPLPLEYIYALRKEIHVFMTWANKMNLAVDMTKLQTALEEGAQKCEQCGGWLLFPPKGGSSPLASPPVSPQPPSSPSAER